MREKIHVKPSKFWGDKMTRKYVYYVAGVAIIAIFATLIFVLTNISHRNTELENSLERTRADLNTYKERVNRLREDLNICEGKLQLLRIECNILAGICNKTQQDYNHVLQEHTELKIQHNTAVKFFVFYIYLDTIFDSVISAYIDRDCTSVIAYGRKGQILLGEFNSFIHQNRKSIEKFLSSDEYAYVSLLAGLSHNPSKEIEQVFSSVDTYNNGFKSFIQHCGYPV